MNSDFVHLDRQFVLLPKTHEEADQEEMRFLWGYSKAKNWSDIENEFRSVILAEAGAGKTEELKERARRGVANGRPAFFIRIEDIENDFENAFEVGNTEAFHDWIASTAEAWFYLDSVDEARLKDPAAFRKAIQRFARRIKLSSHRAHIVVSSRPYAWQPKADRSFMDQELYLPAPPSQDDQSQKEGGGKDTPPSALQIYRLKPLDKSRARLFAEDRGVADFEQLWTEIEQLNLADLAARPFDLDAIICKWTKDKKLEGRLKLLRHIIGQRLDEIDPNREKRQPLEPKKARDGARRLAAAVILTGEAGIKVPGAALKQTGIEAKQLFEEWNPTEVDSLLQRAIFNDVIYGAVRFRHSETRALLAAEWFLELLQRGISRHVVESLIFREQYGEKVISLRLRPILPWLILFDEGIRVRALSIHPEIALEGGDPAELPLLVRREILHGILEQIVIKQDKRTAGDNSSIARIAQPDLADDVLKLLEKYSNNSDAVFFLGRVIWQGQMSNCASSLVPIVVDSTREVQVRIACARAVMTCGTVSEKSRLWNRLLNDSNEIPHGLLAQLADRSSADRTSIDLILRAMEKVTDYNSLSFSGLPPSLHEFIERLPLEEVGDGDPPLSLLAARLNKILEMEPYIEQGECHVSGRFAWLLGPASHVVERMVANRLDDAMRPAAISIMLKVPLAKFWKNPYVDDYKSALKELVPRWFELNDALFWANVDAVRTSMRRKSAGRLTSDWPVYWPEHYWLYAADSFSRVLEFVRERPLMDDRLVALSLAFRIYSEAEKPCEFMDQLELVVRGKPELKASLQKLKKPEVSKVVRQWQIDEKREQSQADKRRQQSAKNEADWIARIKANPDIVRNPPGLKPGGFSRDQYWLLQKIEQMKNRADSRLAVEWSSLVTDFGEDVARAFRDAAVAHWRRYKPNVLSEDGEKGPIYYSLIFAMTGLEIEALESPDFPLKLSEHDLLHALRYLTWELNGFPPWLEKMHIAFPDCVIKAVEKELFWELENTKAGESMHYILHDLVYYAPWLHKELVKPLYSWILVHAPPNDETLRHIVRILQSGECPLSDLAALAKAKVVSSDNSAFAHRWYAIWVGAEPITGIVALEDWLANLDEERSSREAQLFIVALFGGRSERRENFSERAIFDPVQLKTLFILMHGYIRTSEDNNRIGGGSYTPELRDDAQDARNHLLSLISEIPGKEGYVIFKQLTFDHPDPNSRQWMAKKAYERAEKDGELEVWNVEQVAQFETDLTRVPTSHRQLFDIGVNRLTDLKDWLERGSDSPFAVWQRVNDETEMRNLVAGWLNSQSFNRFKCAQENELANKQRPDIWLLSSSVSPEVPIELKLLDANWTGPSLCERLKNQLAGDYLREESGGCGIMLLMWQGSIPVKNWQISGKKVGVFGLRDALKEYWQSISDSFPNVSAIEVIVIDLTVRALRSKK